jgi:hypothetical protein
MRGGLAWFSSGLQDEMLQRLNICACRSNISGISTRLTLRGVKTNRLLSAEHDCLLFRSIRMFRPFTTITGPTPQIQFLYVQVLLIKFILWFDILTLLLYILISPAIILEPSATVDRIYFKIHVIINAVNLFFYCFTVHFEFTYYQHQSMHNYIYILYIYYIYISIGN